MKVSGKPACSTRRADQASKQQGMTRRPGASSRARSLAAGGDVTADLCTTPPAPRPAPAPRPRYPAPPVPTALDALLALLDLEELEVNLFRGRSPQEGSQDRKSTRLNSSHLGISYAVFCLKKTTT